MWQRRDYLSDIDLSCTFVQSSSVTDTVQDHNTTVQRIVERSLSGVINPDELRLNGLTYADFGLSSNMSVFDKLDLIRSNSSHIDSLRASVEPPANEPPANEPPANEPPANEPPAPSA